MYSFVLVVKSEPVAVEDDAVLTTENLESVRGLVGTVSGAVKPNGDCRGVPSSSISFGTGTKTGNIKQRCSRISTCVMVVGSKLG